MEGLIYGTCDGLTGLSIFMVAVDVESCIFFFSFSLILG